LLVLMPKCIVCLAGYAALVTGLAVSGRELCGAGVNDGFFAGIGARLGFSATAMAGMSALVTVGCLVGLAVFALRIRPVVQGQRPPEARRDTAAGHRPATRMAGRRM
jgi:hypothetical protein